MNPTERIEDALARRDIQRASHILDAARTLGEILWFEIAGMRVDVDGRNIQAQAQKEMVK